MSTGKEFIRVARIIDSHGLDGRLKIFLATDFEERFKNGNEVYLKRGSQYEDHRVSDYKEQKKRISLLKLDGISDRDTAHALKGVDIFINKSEAEETRSNLDENSFFFFDLIGCEVFHEGKLFGVIVDILEAGAGEILIVRDNEGKKLYVPFVQDMVDTTDIYEKKIYINPIEGLFDYT